MFDRISDLGCGETALESTDTLTPQNVIRNTICNTQPIFFHAAGPSSASPLWTHVLAYEVSVPAPRTIASQEIYTFFTWQGGTGTYWNNKKLPLFDSLARLQVPVTILGREISDWKNTMKIVLLIRALEVCETPYFIASDLTDVAVTGDPYAAIKLLQKSGADLMYSAEDYFWPPEMQELKKEELLVPGALNTPYAYLNSGMFVGKTKACLSYFQHARSLIAEALNRPLGNPDRRFNDQPIMKKVYVKYFPQVQIDFQCEAFQVITRQKPMAIVIPRSHG